MAARRAEVTAAGATPALATATLVPSRPATATSASGRFLALQAAVLLVCACLLPWWRMENRAPQYGMRVLWVEVSPLGVHGDVKEIDGLGHYVGMLPIEALASVERDIAPYGIALAVLCALALGILKGGRLRTVAALAVAAVPLGFVADLWFWQRYAVTHLEPTAALHLISNRIQAELVGDYTVAQFKVHAEFAAGFWLALVAAANALAFLFTERRRAPRPVAPVRSPRTVATPVASLASLLLFAPFVALAPLAPGAPRAADVPAARLEVGPGLPHATIASALAAIRTGDTIVVHAGLYRENVVLERAVKLIGEPGATIDGGETGTVVLVSAPDCELRGFQIRASGDSLLGEDAGVKVLGVERCTVAANRIDDCLFGILVRSGRAATLRRNHVVGKALPLPRQGDGIRVQDGAGATIEDNVVEASRDLAIWQSHRCETRRNVVVRCRYGLHYMYCDDNLFEGNRFENNETGGAIMYSRRVVLRDNRFEGSRGPSAHGLLIKAGDDILAEGNRFVDNSSGIFLEETPSSLHAGCTFRGNVVGGNDVGVTLQPSVERVLFAGNVFVANRLQVEMLGRSSRGEQNRWSENGRGNYWSDYVGFDADGDGVGDTPYKVEAFFEDLAGRYPAVGLLRLGPAEQALESAARAFPVVKPRPTATDDHPLIAPPPGLAARADLRPRRGLVAGGALSIALALAALWRARAGATGGVA
jgi:nitrous oxidase accessory protein